MTVYRVFLIGGDGCFAGVEIVSRPGDREALGAARSMLDEYPAAEVWEKDRKVGRVEGQSSPQHPA
jgi:hypothetical protein